MNMNISVNTYLRLDDMMMSKILPAVTCGYHVKDHWMVWTIPHRNMTTEIEAWLAAQVKGSHAKVHFLGLYDEMRDHEKGTHTAIGVSLSTATPEMLDYLYDSKKGMSLVKVYNVSDMNPTKNPLIFTDKNRSNFMYMKREGRDPYWNNYPGEIVTPVDPDVIQKFKDSLKGHDFWYSYSDSSSVYRAGEARTKRLIDAGVEMGLTKPMAEKLYKEVYTELSKR